MKSFRNFPCNICRISLIYSPIFSMAKGVDFTLLGMYMQGNGKQLQLLINVLNFDGSIF